MGKVVRSIPGRKVDPYMDEYAIADFERRTRSTYIEDHRMTFVEYVKFTAHYKETSPLCIYAGRISPLHIVIPFPDTDNKLSVAIFKLNKKGTGE